MQMEGATGQAMQSREVPPDFLASRVSLLSNGTWMSPFAMLCQVSPRGVSGGVPKPCYYPGRRGWGTTFLADEPGVELSPGSCCFNRSQEQRPKAPKCVRLEAGQSLPIRMVMIPAVKPANGNVTCRQSRG